MIPSETILDYIALIVLGFESLQGHLGLDEISLWRRDRDSNPGYLAVYTLSKRAPSATRPSLRSIAGLFESNTT